MVALSVAADVVAGISLFVALVPVGAAVAAVYVLWRIWQEVRQLADAVERLSRRLK